jgi:hypothetical protein
LKYWPRDLLFWLRFSSVPALLCVVVP